MKNIGLVGLGFIGKTHLQAYEHIANAEVTAICTRNSSATQELTSSNKISIVANYDDLLVNSEIDIIDICLPTYLHEEYIIKAVNAGKHVICEKPLTLTLESAERIYEAVQENNVKLFVGHVLRFWPEYEVIKSYSEKELLQDIDIVHAQRLGQLPKWSNWFKQPEKSGGALFDLHIHDIDFVTYLLGEVDSVYSVGTRNEYGAWDHVMTTLTFKNNRVAFVEASQRMPHHYPFTMSFRAQNQENQLELSIRAGENIENINGDKNQLLYYANNQVTPIEINHVDAFQKELTYFISCIEQNKVNEIIPLEHVFYTLRILKVIQRSLEEKKVVWI